MRLLSFYFICRVDMMPSELMSKRTYVYLYRRRTLFATIQNSVLDLLDVLKPYNNSLMITATRS